MRVDLDQYVSEHYPDIITAAKQVAGGDFGDLAHEVILQIYESPRPKMEKLAASGELKFWIVRLLINNYRSKTSRYHYKYRKDAIRRRDLAHWVAKWSEPSTWQHERERLLQAIDTALAEVPWFDAAVFSIYWEEGHSLNSLAQSTGISRHTLHASIKKCRDHIKQKNL